MSTRAQNERKFGHWEDLPEGGRRYWLEVAGRQGWLAHYSKLVDAQEMTLRFWQEIYDEKGRLVETHQKYPVDEATGRCRKRSYTMTITKQTTAEKLAAYLRHEGTLAQLVDWAENAVMEGEFAEDDAAVLSAVIARLGVADVRAFGLTWEDCEELLRQLGYSAQVNVVAA